MFKSGQAACTVVIQKANSTPLFHKHQLTRVELLLSRPDTFPWLRDVYPGPPARARPPVILWDEVSTLNFRANEQLTCRLLNFDCAV